MRAINRWLFIFLFVLIGANLSFSQIVYFPYYGKNKVLYSDFDWKVYKTDHFDVFYYADDTRDLEISQTLPRALTNPLARISNTNSPLLFPFSTTERPQISTKRTYSSSQKAS
jgi:hypothetical protein